MIPRWFTAVWRERNGKLCLDVKDNIFGTLKGRIEFRPKLQTFDVMWPATYGYQTYLVLHSRHTDLMSAISLLRRINYYPDTLNLFPKEKTR